MSDLLGELQSYCDERARRWAVTKEKATAPMNKLTADVAMKEALAISQQVAKLIERRDRSWGQG